MVPATVAVGHAEPTAHGVRRNWQPLDAQGAPERPDMVLHAVHVRAAAIAAGGSPLPATKAVAAAETFLLG